MVHLRDAVSLSQERRWHEHQRETVTTECCKTSLGAALRVYIKDRASPESPFLPDSRKIGAHGRL